ncbi:MAG: hydrogenase expression/formation protein HypE [Campylobacteraceae bacterium]|jgi:hydrogenase expression/formation protein HypE|nr:hydrogenase expression/formation protein HypE [Campylobacteraceae bacterium]
MRVSKKILLSHGGGGEEMQSLISDLFFNHFGNEILNKTEDSATLHVKNKIAFTTDSFTVTPFFFNGGDIGKIAIAGTVNDLISVGAKPLYISCGFIIEEGFLYEDLERIVISMKKELEKSGAKIVAGDTKVVPKGKADGIFINTSGIGEIVCEDISSHNLEEGDVIIVSNEVGNHGACVLANREELKVDGDLKSDCASLFAPIFALFEHGIKPKALRDATRGGLSAVLNEWALASHVGIEINESDILVSNEVKGLCEIFGFEPYELANEGTMALCVRKEDANEALKILRKFDECKKANAIGEVSNSHKEHVILKSPWGTSRFLELPKGELLPRIC